MDGRYTSLCSSLTLLIDKLLCAKFSSHRLLRFKLGQLFLHPLPPVQPVVRLLYRIPVPSHRGREVLIPVPAVMSTHARGQPGSRGVIMFRVEVVAVTRIFVPRFGLLKTLKQVIRKRRDRKRIVR